MYEMTGEEKSKLCQKCGDCCKFILLDIHRPDRKDVSIGWMEVRGMSVVKKGDRFWKVRIDYPCPMLVEDDGTFKCRIYDNRPLACREFDGRMEVPESGLKCAWKVGKSG